MTILTLHESAADSDVPISENDNARLTVVLPKQLLARLRDYRFERRYDSMSGAVRELLEVALDAADRELAEKRKARRG